MPEEMKVKITNAMLSFIDTTEGKTAFKAIYGVDGLKKSTDADYNAIREILTAAGVTASDLMKKK
jgi:ABC-type phosphate/phosphonate transport system substrate-binding protein